MDIVITKTEKDLLYLAACALHRAPPDQSRVNGMDLPALYRFAKAHSLLATTYDALALLERLPEGDSSEVLRNWKEHRDKALRKCMLFDAERAALFSEFEKQGIWYLPLKGIILSGYYPRYGMREMSDNDILFDSQKRKAVKQIFRSRGYRPEGKASKYTLCVNDVYQKAPVYNFEMHLSLFDFQEFPKYAAKYENIGNILIKDENNAYGYHFSDEEYYVHIIAHSFKHFDKKGTGIRTLTDIYVLNQKLGGQLDWDYVNQELASLGLLDYDRESKRLANQLFGASALVSDVSLSEADSALLARYLHAGTYGTITNMVNNSVRKIAADSETVSTRTKLKYVLKRLFPNRKSFGARHPLIYRFPIVLPFFWICRILFRLPKGAARAKAELRAVKKIQTGTPVSALQDHMTGRQ